DRLLLGGEAGKHAALENARGGVEGAVGDRRSLARKKFAGAHSALPGVVKRVLDDARAAARLARGDLHGRVDGQSDGIVIGVSALVGRREDGVGTNPAEEGKEAARELLKVLRGFAVRKVEMEAALRPDAGEAQGGESFAVAGAGVFMAGGEAVTLGVL